MAEKLLSFPGKTASLTPSIGGTVERSAAATQVFTMDFYRKEVNPDTRAALAVFDWEIGSFFSPLIFQFCENLCGAFQGSKDTEVFATFVPLPPFSSVLLGLCIIFLCQSSTRPDNGCSHRIVFLIFTLSRQYQEGTDKRAQSSSKSALLCCESVGRTTGTFHLVQTSSLRREKKTRSLVSCHFPFHFLSREFS